MTNYDDIMHEGTLSFSTLDELLDTLSTETEAGADEIDEDWPYTDEDYSSNAPCDTTGYCAGAACPYFFKCKGE